MPTLNPRTNVTLSPSLDLLVMRFATVQGVSKAQVLRELLEAAEPALQRAVLLMETASKAGSGVLTGLALSLGKAQDRVESELAHALASTDSVMVDLVSQAEAVRSRKPALARSRAAVPAPSVSKNPPPSNRGVKSTKRGKSRATAGGQFYSALDPSGARVLLPTNQAFNKSGVIVQVKRRRGTK